jgi:hypothetical protein
MRVEEAQHEPLFDLVAVDEASQMDVAHAILAFCAVAAGAAVMLGCVDKFDPVSGCCEIQHAEKGFGELIVACRNGAVDLEMADDPLDPVSLAIKSLVIANLPLPVRLGGMTAFMRRFLRSLRIASVS